MYCLYGKKREKYKFNMTCDIRVSSKVVSFHQESDSFRYQLINTYDMLIYYIIVVVMYVKFHYKIFTLFHCLSQCHFSLVYV